MYLQNNHYTEFIFSKCHNNGKVESRAIYHSYGKHNCNWVFTYKITVYYTCSFLKPEIIVLKNSDT